MRVNTLPRPDVDVVGRDAAGGAAAGDVRRPPAVPEALEHVRASGLQRLGGRAPATSSAKRLDEHGEVDAALGLVAAPAG